MATFEPVRVHGKELELVDSAKLLEITITRDLSWNTHVNVVIKKAAKRLYFLVQLKRAKASCNDLRLFYITYVRSVLDYAIPVYYHPLPKYLVNELEWALASVTMKILLTWRLRRLASTLVIYVPRFSARS